MPRVMLRRGRPYVALGDDAAPGSTLSGQTPTTAPIDPLLAGFQDLSATLKERAATEERQRWMQIAATLSIPIAAKIWKWLLAKRAE